MTTITLLTFALVMLALKHFGFKPFSKITNDKFYYVLLIMLCTYLGYVVATTIGA